MKYIVIKDFRDKETKEDYVVGDEYPKNAKGPTKKRVKELMSENEYRTQFIEQRVDETDTKVHKG